MTKQDDGDNWFLEGKPRPAHLNPYRPLEPHELEDEYQEVHHAQD